MLAMLAMLMTDLQLCKPCAVDRGQPGVSLPPSNT